jgi:hypothetical protein
MSSPGTKQPNQEVRLQGDVQTSFARAQFLLRLTENRLYSVAARAHRLAALGGASRLGVLALFRHRFAGLTLEPRRRVADDEQSLSVLARRCPQAKSAPMRFDLGWIALPAELPSAR